MARPDKVATVAELTEMFSSSAAVVLTEYRGLKVKDLKELRRSLGGDATYSVAKNTLTQIAAREAGVEGLEAQLSGPTAITFITGDIAAVAKGLRDFAKAKPALDIKGGVLEGRVLEQVPILPAHAEILDGDQRRGALDKAAGEAPSLIGGTGQPAPAAADQQHDTADDESAPQAADAADTTDAADAATE